MERNVKERMPRGLRNNNPLGIRLSHDHYQGLAKEQTDREFFQFESEAWGYRAAFKIIRTYIAKHGCDTVEKIVSRWAPSSENDTEAYINTVTRKSHLPRDMEINPYSEAQMTALVAAMSAVENGREPDLSSVEQGWQLL